MAVSHTRREEIVKSRPGRARDASRDEALRQAALELLAEVGYEKLTIDAVAARAGAGKATVYRRWASKADLVIDAVDHHRHIALPDTGSLRGDLDALAEAKQANRDRALMTRAMAGLMTALLGDADFRRAFRRAGIPGNPLAAVFTRAIERGEIPPQPDLDLIASVVPALIFYRLVMFDEQPDPAFTRSAIERLVLPLLEGAGPAQH
jgi:AcrR family transcriptional regulator